MEAFLIEIPLFSFGDGVLLCTLISQIGARHRRSFINQPRSALGAAPSNSSPHQNPVGNPYHMTAIGGAAVMVSMREFGAFEIASACA